MKKRTAKKILKNQSKLKYSTQQIETAQNKLSIKEKEVK